MQRVNYFPQTKNKITKMALIICKHADEEITKETQAKSIMSKK